MADSALFLTIINGLFAVEASLGVLKDTSSSYRISATGIDDVDGLELNIIGQKSVYLNLTNQSFNSRLSVLDSRGRSVKRENITGRTEILISERLSPGIYYLQLEFDEKLYGRKFLIQP